MSINTRLNKLIGNEYFHSNASNWSIRRRGNVHLNQMMTNDNALLRGYKPYYRRDIVHHGTLKRPIPGCSGIHPPKKSSVATPETMKRLRYSAR